MKSSQTVLCLEAGALSAVEVSVAPHGVIIRAALAARRPRDVDPADPEQYAAWVRGELDDAGIAAKRAAIALPRGNVALKRVPVPPGLSDREIPGAVRLAVLQTQPALSGEVAFDCVLPDSEERAEALAGVIQDDRMDFVRRVLAAAGVRPTGVHLRVEGTAELLRQQDTPASTLAVCAGDGLIELLTVRDGLPDIAREADVSRTADVSAVASVEASRTALLHAPSGVERLAIVAGPPELADRCAEATELPVDRMALPDIDWGDREPVSGVLPLVGLAMALQRGRPRLDFLAPWSPPDPRSAIQRQAVMLVATVAIIAAGGWLLAQRELDAARDSVAALEAERGDLGRRVVEHFRADARLRHMQSWADGDPDWLAHLARLTDELPRRDRATLAAITASVDAEPAFRATRRNSYHEGKWSITRDIRIDIEGAARDRQVSAGLRERLIRSGVYEVSTQGADVDDTFRFTLRSSDPDPARAGEADE